MPSFNILIRGRGGGSLHFHAIILFCYTLFCYPYHFLLSFVNVTKPKKGRCSDVGGKLKKRGRLIKNLNMHKKALVIWLCISLPKKWGLQASRPLGPDSDAYGCAVLDFMLPEKVRTSSFKFLQSMQKIEWRAGPPQPQPPPPPSPMLRA